MPLPCSIISGWPHRYPTALVPFSPHITAYLRISSSTRPTSPVHFSSSHGRLIVGTYVSQGLSCANFCNSSWYPNSHERLAPLSRNSLCSPANLPSFQSL